MGITTSALDTSASPTAPPAHYSTENASHVPSATPTSTKATDVASHGILRGNGKSTPATLDNHEEASVNTTKNSKRGAIHSNGEGVHSGKDKKATTRVACF